MEKMRAMKRAQWRKRRREGKCNEGRPRRKWRNFPVAAVCYSFFLSPFPPNPSRKPLHYSWLCQRRLPLYFYGIILGKIPRQGNSI